MKYYKIDDKTNDIIILSDLPLKPLETEEITHREISELTQTDRMWVRKK